MKRRIVFINKGAGVVAVGYKGRVVLTFDKTSLIVIPVWEFVTGEWKLDILTKEWRIPVAVVWLDQF